MTAVLERPAPVRPAPQGAPPKPPATKRLPFWLRSRPQRRRSARPQPTPREIRWWLGVVWLLLSALLMGFVAHVTIIGGLQHSRAQYILYQDLRASLALATAPLGQLDVDGELVPNGTPIGLLTIQRLGISEVVVQGTHASDLTKGPGHRRDTVFPGQAGTSVIMGRQATYGGVFGNLSGIVPGDRIRFVSGQGTSTFEVFGVRREGDLLPEALGDDAGRLELITAGGIPLAPDGVLHVDAALTSEVQDTPSPVFTRQVLDPAEEAMASDSGGWFPTLFWFQWLALAVIVLRWVRTKWAVWQTWMIGVPVLLGLGAATADAAMTNLPNLL